MTRKSGVLLPIFSLPGRYGIGDIGPEALRFAHFLKEAGQTLWQVLPLTTIDGGCGNSPYSPTSAFAGNPLFISPDELVRSGLLDPSDLVPLPDLTGNKVEYSATRDVKFQLLKKAWERFRALGPCSEYEVFCQREGHWLNDFSTFTAIKEAMNQAPWSDWPRGLRFREQETLAEFSRERAPSIEFHRFEQFLFAKQMAELRRTLSSLGIELVGDAPVYVTLDCADVWSRPQIFDLDSELRPIRVAGVPPDYFSKTGQLWGNPLYNWNALRAEGFRWWVDRLKHLLTFFDRVRIDHFRGLVAYWALPSDAKTAENGEWLDVPFREFFSKLKEAFPTLPLWAENLGILTPEVEDLRRELGLPGMLILHFAFGNPDSNPYAPHNHSPKNVVYTGTHDNNTTKGWWIEDASETEKKNLSEYLGHTLTEETAPESLIRMALCSVAETAVVPMQDYLGLGAEARVNIPSTAEGNWTWRMGQSVLTDDLAARMRKLTWLTGRLS